MKDTILCRSQHLIISNKARIIDKTSDHVYTLRICWLGISLYFPLTFNCVRVDISGNTWASIGWHVD